MKNEELQFQAKPLASKIPTPSQLDKCLPDHEYKDN